MDNAKLLVTAILISFTIGLFGGGYGMFKVIQSSQEQAHASKHGSVDNYLNSGNK